MKKFFYWFVGVICFAIVAILAGYYAYTDADPRIDRLQVHVEGLRNEQEKIGRAHV